jgi:hypothetical protein
LAIGRWSLFIIGHSHYKVSSLVIGHWSLQGVIIGHWSLFIIGHWSLVITRCHHWSLVIIHHWTLSSVITRIITGHHSSLDIGHWSLQVSLHWPLVITRCHHWTLSSVITRITTRVGQNHTHVCYVRITYVHMLHTVFVGLAETIYMMHTRYFW